jgi:hypothetical protein
VRISQFFFEKLVNEIRDSFNTTNIKFIKSDQLSRILIDDHSTAFARINLIGGSDYDISQQEYEEISRLDKTFFYIQNLNFAETTNIRILPIGVEDLKWARNGMPWNFRNSFNTRKKLDKVLVGPFAITSNDRIDCYNWASKAGNCFVIRDRLSNWRYSRLSSQFAFIACPRGNGIDTHRFWETLYRGSIPVVLESAWSRNLVAYGLPLIELQDWRELPSVSRANLLGAQKYETNLLSQSWWRARLISDLGNDFA